MVSKRCFHRSNLYRAICHSFKNFLSLLSPVIDSTREEQASVAFQTAFAVSHAPVWCFSFRSLFNLQGTRSTTAEQSLSYHMSAILSTTFFIFFRCLSSARFRPDRCLSRTARLDYHAWKHLSTANFVFCPLRIEPFLLSAPLMYYPRFPASKPYKNTSLAAGRA